jgi:hypothetical protein
MATSEVRRPNDRRLEGERKVEGEARLTIYRARMPYHESKTRRERKPPRRSVMTSFGRAALGPAAGGLGVNNWSQDWAQVDAQAAAIPSTQSTAL